MKLAKLAFFLAILSPAFAAEAETAWDACLARPARACVLSEARRVSSAIADPSERAGALVAIARAEAKLGLATEAAATRAEAVKLDPTADDPADQVSGYLQAGKIDDALKAARSIGDFHTRLRALAAIATAEEKAGHAKQASDIFTEAVTAGRGMARVYALQPVADEQAGAGLKAEAAATQLIALEEAQAVKQDGMRQIALSIVAIGQARIGAIADALRTTQSIADANSRGAALVNIVQAQAQAGAIGDARSTEEAILDKERAAQALAAIAAAEAKRGGAKEAATTFEQALTAARSIADDGSRAIAIADVAAGQAKAGLTAAAAARFAEAMKTAPPSLMFQVPIAQQMIASGDIADALTLAASLDEQNRLDLLEQIVPQQIESSDFAGALKTAQTFNDAGRRAKLLAEIAANLPN